MGQKYNILCEAQYGFRKGRRTIDPIFILTQIVLDASKKNKPVFSCFVDLAKAFDSVNLECCGLNLCMLA